MNKPFHKLAGLLVLILMSFHLIAHIQEDSALASGKMEVSIGERVELLAESASPGVTYKWVVKKNGEILNNQSTRTFGYTFDQQGEYLINLTATSGVNVIESTSVFVLAGERYERPKLPSSVTDGPGGPSIPSLSPLQMVLETLPARAPDGRIYLVGDSKVRFDLSLSVGDILEYRIDQNIFVDSDQNGIANDDIDNSGHTSYLTGFPWVADYDQEAANKVVAEVTLVDSDGRKVKEQIEMVFEEQDQTGPPVAVLTLSPPADENNIVRLYEDPHSVGFYSKRSTGKILEYRIDRNIFVDSDGDGNPANDIDNVNDPSFKTGDIWETEYAFTDQQIIAQLIVVGEGGKGSRIQRGIVFGDRPAPPVPSLATPEGQSVISLKSDKQVVLLGDPIQFEVLGLQQALEAYTFGWDFDGDGISDKATEGIPVIEHIYELPGVYNVGVTIQDQEGNSAVRNLEVIAKEPDLTSARFSYNVEGTNSVRFTNESVAATNLANKSLQYSWSFGDPDEASFEEQRDQLSAENPLYTYKKAGTYVVTLTITDADSVTDSFTTEITIERDLAGIDTGTFGDIVDQPDVKEEGIGSFLFRLFKIFLTLILIVLGLIVLIALGFFAYLKVQHPDLSFEELVDELRHKLLSMMGVDDLGIEPTVSAPAPEAKPVTEAPQAEEPVTAVPKSEPATTPEAPKKEEIPQAAPAPEKGPTPPWLNGKEVIEGEVVPPESAPAPAEPAPAPTTPPVVEEVTPTPAAPKPEQPTPPAPEAPSSPTPPPASGPTPEGPQSPDQKGPTPDWLKGQ